ncbi:MAG TPA: YegS/Rv2252/BmrU family lipid kinase [Acidimicrobiales bacterium]|nr:YegS/Rv2252/BmrU family lipid kinase [Acidimicrobiales bacterium]
MSSPFGTLSLVVNPHAGGPGNRRRLDRLRAALDIQGLEHVVLPTAGPGDASRLAREALEGGSRFVVAVGGDGTVHEVANGMLGDDGRPLSPGAVLGVVAAGSGCDLIRTFGLPGRPVEAAAHLSGDTVRPLDAARMTFAGPGGTEARSFVNIAEAGLGAATAARAARLPNALGQSRYLVAFWAVLPGYKPSVVRVEVDGSVAYEGRGVNVIVANCRYFGGGMHISPRSDPADGRLEVLVLKGRKTDSFTMLPKVYRGRHLPHPDVVELGGRRVVVEADAPMPVEADGEILGTTPLTVEAVPAALTLKV